MRLARSVIDAPSSTMLCSISVSRIFDAVADRRERPDVGAGDARAGADDDRPAHDRALDRRAGLDHDLALDARLGVDRAVDAALDRVENQAVGLEHVLELAGVLPPALDDVRAHLEAAVDQVLNGVGDLELVAEARLDALDRRRRPRGRTCRRRPARGRSSAPSASRPAGRRGRRPARRRRTSADRARASAGSAPPASRARTPRRTG